MHAATWQTPEAVQVLARIEELVAQTVIRVRDTISDGRPADKAVTLMFAVEVLNELMDRYEFDQTFRSRVRTRLNGRIKKMKPTVKDVDNSLAVTLMTLEQLGLQIADMRQDQS